ncbi:MFS transporter [Amycolatopsis taiwanensis]|uniref:Major facilitator superfamily (MFS) profile domain-containing protein n=1 Tax=Amycolatopsis taiwanensis TaxID=342230 RepID=A0A9W6R8U0_9PSEU|nr:MFS transporter [Amycolatopsis taiwanensis]GLY71008.1 hypothetical protein Atai01_76270 [Amycolatopsis taiwanensis]
MPLDRSELAISAKATTNHGRHPVLIVVLLVLLTEVFAFEFTVVTPGLPDMAAAFGTTSIGLVQSVPLLASAVVIPLLAKWGDVHGKKLTLLLGTLLFVLGTVLCALAPSYALFLTGRGLESFGLVGTVISYGLVRDLLPPKWVPIGIGGLGTGFGASAVLGPLAGGALIDAFGFRSGFWFLLVYAVITGLLVLLFVPESDVRLSHTLDFTGAALLGIGVGALIFASTVPAWRLPAAALGIVLLVVFVLVERRKSQPLISMRLLARPAMSMTLACAAAVGFVVGSEAVLMPLLLRTPAIPGAEQGLGLSALGYALNFALVMGVCAAACGVLSGFLSRRFGPRTALLISAAGWTVSMCLVAAGFADDRWKVWVLGALMGIGQGFYYAAAANLVIEAVPAKVQGVSASMKYTVEQGVGSIAGAIAGAIIAADVVKIVPKSGAIIYGMAGFQQAFLVLAVAAAVGLIVALLMRHGRKPATGGVAPDAAGD